MLAFSCAIIALKVQRLLLTNAPFLDASAKEELSLNTMKGKNNKIEKTLQKIEGEHRVKISCK